MNTNIIKESYRVIMDYVLLNLLIVFITILGCGITFGAAFTAGHNVSYKLLDIDRHTYVVKDFLQSFKQNFVKATIVWISMVLIIIGLFFIHNFAVNTDTLLLQIAIYITVIELTLFSSYFFPILANFEAPLSQLLQNSLLLAHTNIKTTILQMGNLATALLLVFKVNSMFILIAIGLYLFLSSFTLRHIIDFYKQKVRGTTDEIY